MEIDEANHRKTKNARPRPRYETTQARLPPYPALAYLYLVRPDQRMKKFFIGLGAIFLALIVLGGIGIAFVAIRGTALDKESKAYVDAAVPVIVSSWSVQALLDRASPEFTQATQPGDVERLFGEMHSLGKLRNYEGSQGQSLIYHDLTKGTTISASYSAKAQFEAGSVQVDIRLIKHGNQWQILGFHVQPTYHPQKSNQAMRPNRWLASSFA